MSDNVQVPPDAAILIPGLRHSEVEQSIDLIGLKIARAMDRNAKTARAEFLLKEGKDEDYGGGCKTRMLRIVRKDDTGEKPVLDLYEMSYSHLLLDGAANESLIKRISRLGLSLLSNAPRLVSSLMKPGKTREQKMQMALATLILLVLVLYMVVLVFTAVYTVMQRPELGLEAPAWMETLIEDEQEPAETPGGAERKAAGSGEEGASELNILQYLVIVLTALGLLTTQDYQRKLREAATQYTAIMNYFNLGERKGRLSGQLADLLEHIAEKQEPAYNNIHLLSYSFGSILAIDGLYQHGRLSERFRLVKTLVTIGCPFDFIRTYWPGYFKRREALPWSPPPWLNVYSPLDVLGSNFRNDDQDGEAAHGVEIGSAATEVVRPRNLVFTRGVSLESLSFWDILYLTGFKAHASYWERSSTSDLSCFDLLIPELYAGQPVLG
jgi:hypothetical protein